MIVPLILRMITYWVLIMKFHESEVEICFYEIQFSVVSGTYPKRAEFHLEQEQDHVIQNIIYFTVEQFLKGRNRQKIKNR